MGITKEEWNELVDRLEIAMDICSWMNPDTEIGGYWMGAKQYLEKLLIKSPPAVSEKNPVGF